MGKFPPGIACDDLGRHLFILGSGASRACLPDGDANGKRLPVMADFVETLQLAPMLERKGVDCVGCDIEELWAECADEHLQLEMEEAVWSYFSQLQLPSHPTLYDELIFSLRPKDVIATFNWDPLLPQAYLRASAITSELPQIVFLHGSVALGVCHGCRVKGLLREGCCPTCGSQYERSKLFYPINKKEYGEDSFIQAEWETVLEAVKRAYIVTVYGYSAPRTDVRAVDLLRRAFSDSSHFMKEQRQFQVVDRAHEEDVLERWEGFITRSHYGITRDLEGAWLRRYPRRSCEGMASALLFLKPWPNQPFPPVTQLNDYAEPVTKLVSGEASPKNMGSSAD